MCACMKKREIKKTSESIRKKYRAVKAGRIEEDMTLDRHFKPIIKPLQIVEPHAHDKETVARR